ncbi:hypothetical protein J2Z83_000488 [Virgibacillus natechei]|uniref:DUF2197 domain-containing protein n=1 Tax=Virgibacillus natechei TaxID=1216297 RepID=A0ABS4ID75_9BACI|nr:hypothetical protein [Virgibacillus natechei]MBP1968396.1 hypothetical protein [Virgibacillus natechei]UZD13522.1 hypothetical protein OLD84_02890 [Virgibacillus natechei]
MANWLKRILGMEKCYICNNKAVKPRMYINDEGEKVPVCFKCVTYAERRAMKKSSY